MSAQGVKRKLSAILSADVEGYSRLMAEDEVSTVRTLTAYREVMTSLIQQHRGRVVDSPGDNLLAEFSSVVDAVQCGVAVQKEFQARNAELPEGRRMEFRIGINLGDVIEEGDRIYGDGVNIAARLEALADPGGICVSKTAFDHIETKLPLGYEYLGDQTVKNIPKPVGAYRVLMEPRVTVAGEKEKRPSVPSLRRKTVLAGALAVLVVIVGLLVWNFYLRAPRIQPADVDRMAFPLPDKPSIAVLPFDNMSEDPKQEYFSDGLTVDIIAALSKISDLFVIARHSTFTYKGKPVNVKQVAEELGVRYVLEGSVRRAEERVRVTAQLIDALKGDHLWSERYDRALEDIFALQDEITMNILTALQVKLTKGERIRVLLRSTDSLNAYQKYLKGRLHFLRVNSDDNAIARQLFEEAIASDPEFSSAYVDLGWTHLMDIFFGVSKSPKESLGRAAQLAQRAISLDESSSLAHNLLSFIFAVKRQFVEAIAQGEKAVALSPGDSLAIALFGRTLAYAGRYEEALSWLEKAIRLDPIPLDWYFNMVGHCYLYMGKLEEALEALKKNRNQNDITNHIRLAAVYSLLGRKEDASAEAAEILRINPKFSIKSNVKWPIKNKEDMDFLMNALRKAGLPD
jgi:adenylate cyclase